MLTKYKPWLSLSIKTLILFCMVCESPNQYTTHNAQLEYVSLIVQQSDYTALLQSGAYKHWFGLDCKRKDSLSLQGRIRIHGNTGIYFTKKSFQLELYKNSYTSSPRESFILSAQVTDKSFCRYRLASYLFEKAGLDVPQTKPVALYINGIYQGLYLKIERIDEKFLYRRNRAVSSTYQIEKKAWVTASDGVSVESGFSKIIPCHDESYQDLQRAVDALDRWDLSSENLCRWFDIDNLLAYYAVSRICNHWDGFTNNFILYFNPDKGTFQAIPWDLDHTFDQLPGTTLPHFKNGLFEKLCHYPPWFKKQQQLVSALFNYEELTMVLDSLYNDIQSDCAVDPYLGNTAKSRIEEKEFIEQYLQIVRDNTTHSP